MKDTFLMRAKTQTMSNIEINDSFMRNKGYVIQDLRTD